MHSVLLSLLAASVISNPTVSDQGGQQPPKDGSKTAAEIRKALDEKITLDFTSQDFDAAIEYLREKTKLTILVDSMSMNRSGNVVVGFAGGALGFGGGFQGFQGGFGGGNPGLPPFGGNIGNPAGGGLPGFPGQPGAEAATPPFQIKSTNEKLRTVLKNFLNKGHLTYVIATDKLVITTEERGHQLQLGQRVSVEAKDQLLADVLQRLADDSGINLLIDPRESAKTKAKISLQLEDVSVETAVRLLTAMADLSVVSVGNILFVTNDSRAEQLRKENAAKKNAVGGISNFSGAG